MKKVISILLLAIMLLQVLPVAQWANDEVSLQTVAVDEEKETDQCDKSKQGKEDLKSLPTSTRPAFYCREKAFRFIATPCTIPPSPHLDLLVPPPNALA